VPGGFGGAMENWGGITFFETHLLFDPASRGAEARRSIFRVVAHEMAHQWFGDLVTMAWWDNLWLNEGFASWMEEKASEALHPEWQAWLNAVGRRQGVMTADAHPTTHPIRQRVDDESEALAAFDAITYGKGQAVIRMIEDYVGEDAFRAGIRAYMAGHAYGNTTTADLWNALGAASGKPVAAVAADFTDQAGVPLVLARASCAGDVQQITLEQRRFAIHDAAADSGATKAPRWRVPITFGTAGGAAAATVLLDGTAAFAAGRCGEAVKLNFGDTGYYRVRYDDAMRAALTGAIARFAAADRASFLGDSIALLTPGQIEAAAVLDLVDAMKGDDSRAVASQIIATLERFDHLQRTRPQRAAFQAYARAALHGRFERIGWDAAPGESADTGLMRTGLIEALGDFGDAAVIAEAKRRFAAFQRDPQSLAPALRSVVADLAGRYGDRATYDAVLAMARRATDAAERVRYYGALASVRDPELAKATLAMALTDELPVTLTEGVILTVASKGEHRDLAWEFVKANFAALASKQGPLFEDHFAAALLGAFSDEAHARELTDFAPAHKTAGGRTVTARAVDRIRTDADFIARQLPAVDAWVETRR